MVVTQGPIGKNHLSVQSIILLGGVSSLLPMLTAQIPQFSRRHLNSPGISSSLLASKHGNPYSGCRLLMQGCSLCLLKHIRKCCSKIRPQILPPPPLDFKAFFVAFDSSLLLIRIFFPGSSENSPRQMASTNQFGE